MDDFLAKPLHLPTLERALRAQPASAVGSPRPSSPRPSSPKPPSTPEPAPITKPTPGVEQPALDPQKLETLRVLTADQPGILADLVNEYLEASERQIDEIRSGLEAGDAPAVVHAAHSLKGGSGQMSAAFFSFA